MERRAFLRNLVGLSALAASGTLGEGIIRAARATAAVPTSPTAVRIRYIVIPHPDDELEAWSMVAQDPSHYHVFVLMTRGEASSCNDGHGLKPEKGMRVPKPRPTPNATVAQKKAARVDSWLAFLDDMGAADPTVGLVDRRKSVTVGSGTYTFDLFVGPRSARAVFDLGDGQLTQAAVVEAVNGVRAARSRFPITAEDDIVASAYYNMKFSGFVSSSHPDHKAVQDAIRTTDFGLPGFSWGRTVAGDPAAAATFAIPPAIYQGAMAVSAGIADPAVNPNAKLVGAMQRDYGWLAFDPLHQSGAPYWPAGETAARTPFSRVQQFWIRRWR